MLLCPFYCWMLSASDHKMYIKLSKRSAYLRDFGHSFSHYWGLYSLYIDRMYGYFVYVFEVMAISSNKISTLWPFSFLMLMLSSLFIILIFFYGWMRLLYLCSLLVYFRWSLVSFHLYLFDSQLSYGRVGVTRVVQIGIY